MSSVLLTHGGHCWVSVNNVTAALYGKCHEMTFVMIRSYRNKVKLNRSRQIYDHVTPNYRDDGCAVMPHECVKIITCCTKQSVGLILALG